MKKLFILALIPLLGVNTVNQTLINNKNNGATNSTFDETLFTNLVSSLNGALAIESSVTTSTGNSYELLDEVCEDTRYFQLQENGVTTYEDYVITDSEDIAYRTKITISNNAEHLQLVDDDGETPLTFSTNYGSAFRRLTTISKTQFDTYFTHTSLGDGKYEIIPTELGYGFLNHDLADFFYYFEEFVWDKATYNIFIDDVKFFATSSGVIDSFTFNRNQKDKFGGFLETFDCKISYISEVRKLSGLPSKMNETDKAEFTNKINNFQAKINKGNLTQSISTSGPNKTDYKTYYIFDSVDPIIPSMMISDLSLYDMSYGETFFGALPIAGQYQPYAFSPDSDFMDAYSNITFDDFRDLLPNFAAISADFFEKQEDKYVLDFTTLSIVDYLFSVDILNALLNPMDPILVHTNNYIDMSIFDYNLQSLIITFDENDNLNATLSFLADGKKETTSISFEDFETTDIRNVKALESVINLLIGR